RDRIVTGVQTCALPICGGGELSAGDRRGPGGRPTPATGGLPVLRPSRCTAAAAGHRLPGRRTGTGVRGSRLAHAPADAHRGAARDRKSVVEGTRGRSGG